ncbi:HAD-IIB family hydrolase [Desulfosporosinus nitroreducens]|uniref:HAD-IIB family hydrolase n=1 Tax=Desulfosporosinus nitroreducens TaxID=2018668 RepID=UPI00207C6E42|nr:HAD-IIB family hydrolase [Desulfosporosinus nitroreducens]MCO1604723.1 HAD-IIB family hydrolase [Desulfosporosinus nitroreducens]
MRNGLYISDLDGTLLRNDATLSDYSKTKIQELVRNGVLFSVASARSVVAIQKIFVGVKLNLPVIEFNGAFISDLETGYHEFINEIDKSITSEILSLSSRQGCLPFISSFNGTEDCLYHGSISTDTPSEWSNAAVSAAQTWDSKTVVSLPRSNQNKVTIYAYNYGYNGTYGQAYLNTGIFASTFTSGNIQFNTFYDDYGSDFRLFIAKHEFGHILSLDDVDHYDTMYDGYSLLPTPAALVDDLLPEILGSDDITGVNTIYEDVPN